MFDNEPRWRESSLCDSACCVQVATWTKPSRCAQGDCVEVRTEDDRILVRDSKAPQGPVLEFTAAEWEAFLGGAKAGEFDLERLAKKG